MTRTEYMRSNSKSDSPSERAAIHRAYYAQFVDERVRIMVMRTFGKTKLLESRDEHFNDIRLQAWDCLVSQLGKRTDTLLREKGDWLGLGTGVCILKEAARQLVEVESQGLHPPTGS